MSGFPYNAQKRLIAEISNSFLDLPLANLSSWGHITWTMEILGHAFKLPIEDVSLMKAVKTIYLNWILGDKSDLPSAIKDSRGTPYQDQLLIIIAQHFSLAFDPRTLSTAGDLSTSGEVKLTDDQIKTAIISYGNLCLDIVNGFVLIIRNFDATLSKDAWVSLLKVIFGISETVLGSKNSYKEESTQTDLSVNFADRLAAPLVELLIESIIRAKYTDSFLWGLIMVILSIFTYRTISLFGQTGMMWQLSGTIL